MCVLRSGALIRLSRESSGVDCGEVAVVFQNVECCHTMTHPCSPSLVRHIYQCAVITVIHCWSSVASSAKSHVENVCLFISVVVYVDTAAA